MSQNNKMDKIFNSKIEKFNRLKQRREKAKHLSFTKNQITERLNYIPLVFNGIDKSFTIEELTSQMESVDYYDQGQNSASYCDLKNIIHKCPWLADLKSSENYEICGVCKEKVIVRINGLYFKYNGGICYENKEVDQADGDCIEPIEVYEEPFTEPFLVEPPYSPNLITITVESESEINDYNNLDNLAVDKAMELCLEKIQDSEYMYQLKDGTAEFSVKQYKPDITVEELKNLAKYDFRKSAYLKKYLKFIEESN